MQNNYTSDKPTSRHNGQILITCKMISNVVSPSTKAETTVTYINTKEEFGMQPYLFVVIQPSLFALVHKQPPSTTKIDKYTTA